MMKSMSIWCAVLISACTFFWPAGVHAESLSRDRIIANASKYANLKWFCAKKNARKDYNLLVPGRQYKGVPYNWGGFDAPDKFVQKVKEGAVAGNYKKFCGKKLCIRDDFAGLDCSGLVSRSWEISRYSTRTLPGITIKIPRELLQPGDVLNAEGKHVLLFDRFDDDNLIWVYESAVWVRSKNVPPAGVVYRAVDVGDEYLARRYYKFIKPGDRIKAEKTIVVLRQLNGKKKLYIRAGTKGEILKGPTVRGKGQKSRAPSDVWVYVKFENGKEGWAIIKHLTLLSANS